MFARLSFWYGLDFEDICTMPIAAIKAYLERIPMAQAEMRMMLLDPIQAPHMENRARKRMIRNWERLANVASQSRRATDAELALIGIKAIHV